LVLARVGVVVGVGVVVRVRVLIVVLVVVGAVVEVVVMVGVRSFFTRLSQPGSWLWSCQVAVMASAVVESRLWP